MLFQKTLKPIALLDVSSVGPISKLPQFYRADWDFFLKSGNGEFDFPGSLLQQLILLTKDAARQFQYVSIDSRSHMLMPGMFPCIPGWHCDDFYRPVEGGQPDLENVIVRAPQRHFLFVLGDNSRTEFVDEDIELPSPAEVQKYNGGMHPLYYYYDVALERMNPKTTFVEPNHLYEFGPLDFHRGQAATKPGWRYFMRLTFSDHREPKNELRYQTQVYTTGRVSW